MALITESAGNTLAEMILTSCTDGGILRGFVDDALQKIGPVDSINGLTIKQINLLMALMDENPHAVDTAQKIVDEVQAVSEQRDQARHIPSGGIPEVYPAGRPRGNGVAIEVKEATLHPAVYSYDVIQQTSTLIEEDVDQMNVVAKVDIAPSRQMPSGKWAALTADVKLHDVMGLGVHYKICDEDIAITLEPEEYSVLDSKNFILGGRTPDTDKPELTQAAQKRILRNASRFLKYGNHLTHSDIAYDPDHLSPKVDGCPLFIHINSGGGRAYTRIGDKFSAAVWGRFEDEGRKGRKVKILVEAYPNIEKPEKFFLLKVWIFGVPNELGHKFEEELLEKKRITIHLGEEAFKLELPTFETVLPEEADGLVIHCGKEQYFVKPKSTIDVQKPETKKYLEKEFKLKAEWREGLWEYVVERKPGGYTALQPLRKRTDKLRENRLQNIENILESPDLLGMLEMLQSKNSIAKHKVRIPPNFYGFEDDQDFDQDSDEELEENASRDIDD